MSMLQTASISTGGIVGGLILLKGTSLEFAQSIGLNSPISTLQTQFLCIAGFTIVSTICIHVFYS